MIFVDTEFSKFNGELISIALVNDKDTVEFYGVLPLPEDCHPWVIKNVVPYLNKEHEPLDELQYRLFHYLQPRQDQVIVADWPEDLAWLLRLTCKEEGFRYKLNLKLELIDPPTVYKSEIPHNALADARALRKNVLL